MFLCQKKQAAGISNSQWEEVDDYTYEHWETALNNDGTPGRYTGNRVMVTPEDEVVVDGTITKQDLGIVARLLGVKIDGGSTGYMKQPEYIQFRGQRGSVTIRCLATGITFKKVA